MWYVIQQIKKGDVPERNVETPWQLLRDRIGHLSRVKWRDQAAKGRVVINKAGSNLSEFAENDRTNKKSGLSRQKHKQWGGRGKNNATHQASGLLYKNDDIKMDIMFVPTTVFPINYCFWTSEDRPRMVSLAPLNHGEERSCKHIPSTKV